MTDLWIAPDLVFDGQDILSGQAVLIRAGQIADLAPTPATARRIKGCLTPGFVDLQVNGGGGVLLNNAPTRAGIAQIAAAHRSCGTVAIMPTLITDHPGVLDKAAEAAIAARSDPGVIGLHIEGPHIAVARRGTHAAAFIRPLDMRTMDIVARLRRHHIAVMITLAPEAASNAQIAALAGMGALVSLGHTDCTAEAIVAAQKAGAVCATHLFNAMSPMTSRAPGAVGAVLNGHLHAGLICDGHHVDDRMIQLALRARPAQDLTFLVSDAMATVGGPDHFDLYGQRIQLRDGRLINAQGHLAGAHVTQAAGVARLVQRIGIPLDAALRMAVTVPARVVGQAGLAQLAGRSVDDLLILSEDLATFRTLGHAVASR